MFSLRAGWGEGRRFRTRSGPGVKGSATRKEGRCTSKRRVHLITGIKKTTPEPRRRGKNTVDVHPNSLSERQTENYRTSGSLSLTQMRKRAYFRKYERLRGRSTLKKDPGGRKISRFLKGKGITTKKPGEKWKKKTEGRSRGPFDPKKALS